MELDSPRVEPPPAASPVVAAPPASSAAARGRLKTGPYRLLHDYLRERYADTVVLTFEQIEDLGGFPLPPEARTDEGWWTRTSVAPTDAHPSEAWVLANRSARANLQARTVVFDRLA